MCYRQTLQLVAFASISISVSGCAFAIPPTYTKKDEITLPNAMKDLVCGFKTLENESARLDSNAGVLIDQAEVTLNLKASAQGDGTLVVDAKPNVPAFGTLGVSYTDKTVLAGSRENQIKITLKSLLTAQINDPAKRTLALADLRVNTVNAARHAFDDPCVSHGPTPEEKASATRIDSPIRKK